MFSLFVIFLGFNPATVEGTEGGEVLEVDTLNWEFYDDFEDADEDSKWDRQMFGDGDRNEVNMHYTNPQWPAYEGEYMGLVQAGDRSETKDCEVYVERNPFPEEDTVKLGEIIIFQMMINDYFDNPGEGQILFDFVGDQDTVSLAYHTFGNEPEDTEHRKFRIIRQMNPNDKWKYEDCTEQLKEIIGEYEFGDQIFRGFRINVESKAPMYYIGTGVDSLRINARRIVETGIEEEPGQPVLDFPSLITSGTARINYRFDAPGTIQLFSVDGRLLESHTVTGEGVIQILNLSAGVYMVRFKSQGVAQTCKLIITR